MSVVEPESRGRDKDCPIRGVEGSCEREEKEEGEGGEGEEVHELHLVRQRRKGLIDRDVVKKSRKFITEGLGD